jgi:urease subunit gamma/beta
VHLTPHEQERLMIYVAADVARKRKERGTPLNYPEAVALITAYVLEEARDGRRSVADLMASPPSTVLDRGDLMPGVAEMLSGIQIEATFPDGTKMVSIRHPLPPLTVQPEPEPACPPVPQPVCPPACQPPPEPVCQPVPEPPPEPACPPVCQPPPEPVCRPAPTLSWVHPGEIEHPACAGRIAHNKGRQITVVSVVNDDDRPIQVGSHYHFFEANPRLTITPDRRAAYGKRLNIPAGNSVRFEPNCPLQVQLVDIEGDRIVMGLRGEVGGKL